MKRIGKSILCSDLHFTFETPDDRVSDMANRAIQDLDRLVCQSPEGCTTSLSDVVQALNRITYGDPDVKIAVEEVRDEDE